MHEPLLAVFERLALALVNANCAMEAMGTQNSKPAARVMFFNMLGVCTGSE
jgi:hypothetical protein